MVEKEVRNIDMEDDSEPGRQIEKRERRRNDQSERRDEEREGEGWTRGGQRERTRE